MIAPLTIMNRQTFLLLSTDQSEMLVLLNSFFCFLGTILTGWVNSHKRSTCEDHETSSFFWLQKIMKPFLLIEKSTFKLRSFSYATFADVSNFFIVNRNGKFELRSFSSIRQKKYARLRTSRYQNRVLFFKKPQIIFLAPQRVRNLKALSIFFILLIRSKENQQVDKIKSLCHLLFGKIQQ